MNVAHPTERIRLFVSAKDVANIRAFRTLNSYVVLYEVEPKGTLKQIGITAPVKESHEPVWVKHFVVDYVFEAKQEFVLRIHQCDHGDDRPAVPSPNDLIGEARFTLSQLLKARMQKGVYPLVNLKSSIKNLGTVIVRAESVVDSRNKLRFNLSAEKLLNREGFFGTSDPFVIISRLVEDGSYVPVWQTAHIKSTLSPNWGELIIPISTLSNGDEHCPLKFQIFDFEEDGRHNFMGEVTDLSIEDLVENSGKPYKVLEPSKSQRPNYECSGTLTADNVSIDESNTLADYLAGNCDINLIIGVDFTLSNIDYTDPASLHYVDPDGEKLNPYQLAISAVGRILIDYDRDGLVQVYGFGARQRGPDGKLMPAAHCIPLHPAAEGGTSGCAGIDGVLETYKAFLSTVQLSGPTMFAPIITKATEITTAAGCSAEKQNYTLLMLLTDGNVDDMKRTVPAIIKASSEPMSIVIVGIGEENFDKMHKLDSDDELLTSNATTAERDIVQFVSFRDVIDKGTEVLAQEVLAEIPGQFLQYMRSKGISPCPRPTE